MIVCDNYAVIHVLWNPDTVDSSTFAKHDMLLRNRIQYEQLLARCLVISY